ncbi:MAG: Holliday junction resolvase RecU, partial [Mycoplasma sp.]|nr:Holliday junction resolvase RecU [Mycoplasma sp.]
MQNYKNKGMLFENIINNSIKHYIKNKIAIFWKAYLPITILKKTNKSIEGVLQEKAQPDYYGVYKGNFIVFEAKSIVGDKLVIQEKWKHQIEILKNVRTYQAVSFLLIYFKTYNKVFRINIKHIDKLKFNYIDLAFAKKYGKELE